MDWTFLNEFEVENFQIVIDLALLVIRILLPFLAVIIVFQCFSSMRRHRRDEKPLIMLQNNNTGEGVPVLYWENSLGRGKSCDITVADSTVSRDHAVLLRREEGWLINDTGSKSGTYVNGELTNGRHAVYVDDHVTVGSTTFTIKRADEYTDISRSWFFNRPKNKKSITPRALMMLITIFLLFLSVEACISVEIKDFFPLEIFGIFTIIAWVFYFFSRYALKRQNFELESLAIFLSGIGILLLCRQEVRQTYVQMIAMAAGMVVFCILIKFVENPDRVEKWRLPISIAAIGFLAVNIVFGSVQHGAGNWIIIGGVSVQPSEFVKIAYIFVGAASLDMLLTKKNLLQFIIFSAVCVGSLFIMSDFGTAVIFFGTFLIIAFMRSGDLKTVILALAAAVFGSTMILRFKPYIAQRFEAWGNVWKYADSTGYQQARVLTYAASGGLFGVGIGNGYLKYIFASESDLVFGLMCEELGLIIALVCAIGIGGLAFYARAITTRSRSTFYSISACCAAGLLVLQSCLNVFGATDILPLTGVTLPFISLGGSSMISCWGLIAFIKAADERTYAKKN